MVNKIGIAQLNLPRWEITAASRCNLAKHKRAAFSALEDETHS